MRAVEILTLNEGRYVRAAHCAEGLLAVPGCPDLTLDVDALWAELDRLG